MIVFEFEMSIEITNKVCSRKRKHINKYGKICLSRTDEKENDSSASSSSDSDNESETSSDNESETSSENIKVESNIDSSTSAHIVAITSYKQNTFKHWEVVTFDELSARLKMKHDLYTHGKCPANPNDKSVYECIESENRKIYLDIEKIPADQPELIEEIKYKLNEFFTSKCRESMYGDMEFVLTFNPSSPSHEGLSYHLICTNYCMDYKNMYNAIAEFLSTDGAKYLSYIDVSVYSSLRLFKLPYYYGISSKTKKMDTSGDNYHRIQSEYISDNEFYSNFIIQCLKGCNVIYTKFADKPEYKKKLKRFSGGNKETHEAVVKLTQSINQLNQTVEEISELILPGGSKESKVYNLNEIIELIKQIEPFKDKLGKLSLKKFNEISERINGNDNDNDGDNDGGSKEGNGDTGNIDTGNIDTGNSRSKVFISPADCKIYIKALTSIRDKYST